ncbi:MAG: anaerobic ribonucleoside-triphosphate reductase activating protein [Terrimicrobiaceae bacterium]|nr:anaerobic ribonucleoside-triphosphate reductase activating protein [Terrimicrobiaceae bacterium]
MGGVEPFTTVDFPGRLAAVVFCQGCPWACPYCHNAHLRPFVPGRIAWETIREFLGERRGFLDGVVFGGGEPTAQPALAAAMREVSAMGYAIGLHTAGMFPERLRTLLPLLEWVGLDIKAPLDARYDRVAGRAGSARLVRRSLELTLASGVRLQLRTTVDTELLSPADLEDISRGLESLGAPPTVWQPKIQPGSPTGGQRKPAGPSPAYQDPGTS